MGGRLPDFLGLGVQKGGTTSLHCLLEQHPEVFLPPVKEVHYFSLNFASGEAWYRSLSSVAVKSRPTTSSILRCQLG